MKPNAAEKQWKRLLRDLHDVEDVDRAVRACELLDELADESRVQELYALLREDDFFVREAAAIPLARLEGVRAFPALLDALTRGEQEGQDNDGLNTTLVELLQTYPQETTPALLALLESGDSVARAHGAWALGFVAERISPDVLLKLLHSEEEPRVKSAIIGSLGAFKNEPAVVDAIAGFLEDGDEQVRVSSLAALGYLGDSRVIPALQAVLDSSSGRTREFAGIALQQLQNRG